MPIFHITCFKMFSVLLAVHMSAAAMAGVVAGQDFINSAELGNADQMHKTDASRNSPEKWLQSRVDAVIVFEPHHHDVVIEHLLPTVKKTRDMLFEETGVYFAFPRRLTEDTRSQVFITFGSPEELTVFAGIFADRLGSNRLIRTIGAQTQTGSEVCAADWLLNSDGSIEAVMLAVQVSPSLQACAVALLVRAAGMLNTPNEQIIETNSAGEISVPMSVRRVIVKSGVQAIIMRRLAAGLLA